MSKRFANYDWDLADDKGWIGTWERISIAVLMDIRDELRSLNQLLRCKNFLDMPNHLRKIARNTTKKRSPKRRP